MADDSIDITEPFDFHPCNSPRGMLYYDLNVLTTDQQENLNVLRRNIIREDEKYLAKHPQVRALIALITRHVLTYRPRINVPDFVGQFFMRPRADLEYEMDEYIQSREPHVCEGDSAVILQSHRSSEEATLEEEDTKKLEETLEELPRNVLDEIVDKTYERLGIDRTDAEEWKLEPWMYGTEADGSVVTDVITEVLGKMKDERLQILEYLKKAEMEAAEDQELEAQEMREGDLDEGGEMLIEQIEQKVDEEVGQASNEEQSEKVESKPEEIQEKIEDTEEQTVPEGSQLIDDNVPAAPPPSEADTDVEENQP